MRGRRAAAACGALFLAACGGSERAAPLPSAAPARITIMGASSMVALCSEAANRFMKVNPGVIVEVSSGTSHSGVGAVADGTATIGTSDLFATGPLAGGLEDHRVAVVGIGVFAHKGAYNDRVSSLSTDQIRRIFAGRVRDWKEVGGGNQAMQALHRSKESGTRYVFGSVLMKGEVFGTGSEIGSSGRMQTALRETPGAISYLVLSYAHADLKPLAIDGVPPSEDTIAGGTYPLWAYEHMYVKPPVSAATRSFLEFVMTPAVQAGVLPGLGFIPMAKMKVSRDHD
jgi:phosphate transport system substrate-binding protein